MYTPPRYVDHEDAVGFTPAEARNYLQRSMESLRLTPNEKEALLTLMDAATPDTPEKKAALRNKLSRELAKGAPEGADAEQLKLRIYVNRSLDWTPNKRAAHAAHAALVAVGAHPGTKVVVLDAGPTKIEKMSTVIHDAGHTELYPGTMTAGTNWPEDSAP